MLNTYKQNISIDKLRQDEAQIAISGNSSDFISYPEFLKYFRDIPIITKHNLVIGINFTYGWMPTMFSFQSVIIEEAPRIEEAVQILNLAKEGQIPTAPELQILKECFNNSLVGASKLLHFINPTKFAIWDSRVYRYLTNLKPHSYRLNNYNSYLDFLEFCNYISNENGFMAIHNSLIHKVGYQMTKYRTAELIMYFGGERPKESL
jgi:hypothetical protein